MNAAIRLVPIYTSRGDWGGVLSYPYIFSRQGEYIGWVTADRQVYSVHGHYIGWFTDDRRILRKISDSFDRPRLQSPPPPERIALPATMPLAPLMAELTYGIIDVLLDAPELMPPVDFGELREDLD